LTRGDFGCSQGSLNVDLSFASTDLLLGTDATIIGPTGKDAVLLTSKQNVKTVLLRIQTAATLAPGVYHFTATAKVASAVETTTATLYVGTVPVPGPDAVNDIADTDPNTAVTIDVRANDLPAPALAVLTVISTTQGANGTVVNNN